MIAGLQLTVLRGQREESGIYQILWQGSAVGPDERERGAEAGWSRQQLLQATSSHPSTMRPATANFSLSPAVPFDLAVAMRAGRSSTSRLDLTCHSSAWLTAHFALRAPIVLY